MSTAFYTVFSPQQEQDNPASSWLHDEFRILSVFPYVSPLSFALLPYLQFCRLFFLFIFIVLWVLFLFFSPLGLFFFSFFLAAKLNCYSVRMSIKIHFNLNGISVRHDL